MKTTTKVMLAAFAVGVMGFNLLNAKTTSSSSSTALSFNNIKALQASAGESGCDKTSSVYCSITTPSGTLIEGEGQPWYKD
ncbi:hypothetical protein [Mucilaginibacter sp. HD30]